MTLTCLHLFIIHMGIVFGQFSFYSFPYLFYYLAFPLLTSACGYVYTYTHIEREFIKIRYILLLIRAIHFLAPHSLPFPFLLLYHMHTNIP